MTNVNETSPRGRVLIVDDNVAACHALAKFLDHSGFAVTVATDGATAFAAMDTPPAPEFVLTDLLLPDTDGRDIAGRARQRRSRHDMPSHSRWSTHSTIVSTRTSSALAAIRLRSMRVGQARWKVHLPAMPCS